MPARRPPVDRQAVEAFVEPLEQAIRCISYTGIRRGEGRQAGASALTLPERWVELAHPDGLRLSIIHLYTVDAGVVHSAAYHYDIADGQERDVLQFHWHPNTRITYPHVHVRGQTDLVGLSGRHIPTGRVSLESVVRFLIDELSVEPVETYRGTWRELLDRNERQFFGKSSWKSRPDIESPAS